MNKTFRVYAIAWLIILVVFNVLCFATPNEAAGYTKLDAAFWTAYVFITLSFIVQLVCAYAAFRADSLRKLFYNIPLIRISYTGLSLMLIFGALFIIIPGFPAWLAAILSVLIMGFNAVAVIKAGAAGEVVESIDRRTEQKISFIRELTADAQGLLDRAAGEEKEACKKVYEELRYSDPVSGEGLSLTEAKIRVKISELAESLGKGAPEKTAAIADEAVALIKERSRIVKSNK